MLWNACPVVYDAAAVSNIVNMTARPLVYSMQHLLYGTVLG